MCVLVYFMTELDYRCEVAIWCERFFFFFFFKNPSLPHYQGNGRQTLITAGLMRVAEDMVILLMEASAKAGKNVDEAIRCLIDKACEGNPGLSSRPCEEIDDGRGCVLM